LRKEGKRIKFSFSLITNFTKLFDSLERDRIVLKRCFQWKQRGALFAVKKHKKLNCLSLEVKEETLLS